MYQINKQIICLILTILIVPISLRAHAIQTVEIEQPSKTLDCDATLFDLENSDALLQQILNPVNTSEDQLKNNITWAIDFDNCLNQVVPTEETDRQALAKVYNLIFLIFASGLDTPIGETQLETVELNSVDDPAVKFSGSKSAFLPHPVTYLFAVMHLGKQCLL